MSEENEGRQSFRRRAVHNMPQIRKDRFGNTVCSYKTDSLQNEDDITCEIDEETGNREVNGSILNSADTVLQNLVNTIGEEEVKRQLAEKYIDVEIDEDVVVNDEVDMRVLESVEQFDKLASRYINNKPKEKSFTMDDIVYSKLRNNQTSVNNCQVTECASPLPRGARFCPQCGHSQLARHCTGCGYQFVSKEKYCPECGQAR